MERGHELRDIWKEQVREKCKETHLDFGALEETGDV